MSETTPATKPAWQSKTILVNVLLALTPFVPGASEFIAANPEFVPAVFTVVNVILRLITKDKVTVA